ncbi:helix-turn-helix domain-containing protein [Ktedonospora formicarum]|uniref:HTH araC/xylS-type domain-containing protein n=1 Tax=Ktedonospora formicarum TaxID=2778364 RepID=A0A8J3HTY8_9CHLR|nr:AraC family transcriptional regulator [Ktedonospora formicarum]GHO41926.1 hypothetical protein KSX_00890 [Ktedonospora formicarum]
MMERSITIALDRRPDILYVAGELAVGQMRGTSPCSRKGFHAHEGYRLEFVDKGSMWLLEPQKRRSLVGQGQYYVLRPDQEHSQEVDPHIRTLFVNLPKQQVEEVVQELMSIKKQTFLDPTIALAQREIFTLLKAIAAEVEHSISGMQIMLQSLGIQLTVQLLRAQQQGEDEGELQRVSAMLSPEIRRSVDFIHAYYTQDLSLQQVAASASLSPYHFLRLFKQQIGITPHAYLRRLRLQQAALFLSQSDEPVSDIAYRLGFSSPAHLTEAFRRHYGLTPSQYRKR